MLRHGTYLAQRWHCAGPRKLSYVPDGSRSFFADTRFDEAGDCLAMLGSFSDSGLLAEYTQQMRLPENCQSPNLIGWSLSFPSV